MKFFAIVLFALAAPAVYAQYTIQVTGFLQSAATCTSGNLNVTESGYPGPLVVYLYSIASGSCSSFVLKEKCESYSVPSARVIFYNCYDGEPKTAVTPVSFYHTGANFASFTATSDSNCGIATFADTSINAKFRNGTINYFVPVTASTGKTAVYAHMNYLATSGVSYTQIDCSGDSVATKFNCADNQASVNCTTSASACAETTTGSKIFVKATCPAKPNGSANSAVVSLVTLLVTVLIAAIAF